MIEDIKDRIQKLIDSEQLTSSKFAEIIGVQRATISHVINGRNQPSLDLVRKVLISFSTLSSEWLIFGRGPMYKDGKKGQALFDEEASKTEASDNEDAKQKLEDEEVKSEKETTKDEKQEKESESEKEFEQNTDKPHNSKSPPQTNNVPADDNDSEVEKIIILNNDKTFTEYRKR